MTDVSAGFRPPCWCPCRWAPTWRFHTNLYKFGENVSPHIFHKKNCCDPNLGKRLCIYIFFLFPGSGLNLLNGFDFLFWSILNSVTLKTSNSLKSSCHNRSNVRSGCNKTGPKILAIPDLEYKCRRFWSDNRALSSLLFPDTLVPKKWTRKRNWLLALIL